MASSNPPIPVLDRSRLKKITATGKSHVTNFRVLLVGGKGVGKTALVVRFLTKRFIGDYDSSSERLYQHTDIIFGSPVHFMILDTIDHEQKTDVDLKDQINWADAFIVIYSVTDSVSYREVDRLKFLINHLKKSKSHDKLPFLDQTSHHNSSPIVFLVANKQDVYGERMVTYEQGEQRSQTSGFSAFYEVSVRESVRHCQQIFLDLYGEWAEGRKQKSVRLDRSSSSLSPSSPGSLLRSLQFKRPSLEEKSRSPSPSLTSRSSDGSVSPGAVRGSVKSIITSGSSRHLGDDLWMSKYESSSGKDDDDFAETVSIRVPEVRRKY